MTLRQSHFVEPVPLVVAREFGQLDRIDVSFEKTRGSAAQLYGLQAKELDLVVTAMDNLFEWTRAGAELRLIAQMERTTPLRLMARTGLSSVTELAGRRFAVDAAMNGFALIAQTLFNTEGIDVEVVEVGGVRERMEALLAGEVDATLLGPPFYDLAEQAEAVTLLNLEKRFPALPGQGLVARTEVIGSPELDEYLRSLAKAMQLTSEISNLDGIAAMERAGFGPAASAHWGARPETLNVQSSGLEFLTEVRSDLGLLRDGDIFALHDPEPLRVAQNSPQVWRNDAPLEIEG